jgi:hypothetical protein
VRNLYENHFILKPGTKVYVPTDEGRERGKHIKEEIERRWAAPSNYYHLRDGGHVAAAKVHQVAPYVSSVDLKRFFDQVSRTKVHRALKSIGVPHADAWDMACDSAVDKNPPQRKFSIPFGFVQSPLIASLVLSRSALGVAIQRLNGRDVQITVYVDDITISGPTERAVSEALEQLESAAVVAGLEFNADKRQDAAPTTVNFNIEFGSGKIQITDDRLNGFRDSLKTANEYQAVGILSYVGSVNPEQYEKLIADLPM